MLHTTSIYCSENVFERIVFFTHLQNYILFEDIVILCPITQKKKCSIEKEMNSYKSLFLQLSLCYMVFCIHL